MSSGASVRGSITSTEIAFPGQLLGRLQRPAAPWSPRATTVTSRALARNGRLAERDQILALGHRPLAGSAGFSCSRNSTGSSQRMAVLSRPLASAGVLGTTTRKPGMCMKNG